MEMKRISLQEQVRSLENSLEGRGPVDALLLRIQWEKETARPMSRAQEDTGGIVRDHDIHIV